MEKMLPLYWLIKLMVMLLLLIVPITLMTQSLPSMLMPMTILTGPLLLFLHQQMLLLFYQDVIANAEM